MRKKGRWEGRRGNQTFTSRLLVTEEGKKGRRRI